MKPHSNEVRQKAIELWQSGQKKSEISRQLGVDYDTLLGWIERFSQDGAPGLNLRYACCGRNCNDQSPVRIRALELMRQHKDWGAAYLRLNLQREFPGEKLAGPRQLQRWVAQAGIRQKGTRLPTVQAQWAHHAFERVQVDAKERLVTRDGRECCYLNFTDEYTGAALDAFVFPLGPNQPGIRSSGS